MVKWTLDAIASRKQVFAFAPIISPMGARLNDL